jgi:hypothetical protein
MRAALCACLTSEGQPTPPLALMPLIALISPSPGVVSSSRSRGGNGRAYAQLALRIRALMLRRPRENFYRVARPRSADQPFLPKNQRQNRFHQPDASHSLPMCGMNALRAPCGFFMLMVKPCKPPKCSPDWLQHRERYAARRTFCLWIARPDAGLGQDNQRETDRCGCECQTDLPFHLETLPPSLSATLTAVIARVCDGHHRKSLFGAAATATLSANQSSCAATGVAWVLRSILH